MRGRSRKLARRVAGPLATLLALSTSLTVGTGKPAVSGRLPAQAPPDSARYHPHADVTGGVHLLPGEYTVFVYRWPRASAGRAYYQLLLKVKDLRALPVGKPVAVASKGVKVSCYWMVRGKEPRPLTALRGTVTRLATSTTSHTLRLELSSSALQLRRQVVFGADTTSLDFQPILPTD